MKICLINPTDFPRTEVFDLSSHLSHAGYEVTILFPTNNKDLNADVKKVPFPAYFLPKIHYTIPHLINEYSKISDLVIKGNYDIIQACDYDYLTCLPPLFVKRKTNIPLVITTDAFPGISWFFGNHFVDTVGKIYTQTLGKLMFNFCDKLVVLSNNLAEDSKNIGILQKKVCVIPNGVNFNQFSPDVDGTEIRKKLNISNNEKIILFVGRLSLVKRIDVLIDVTKKLSKEGLRVKTVIVGDGEYRDYYYKLAQSCNDIIFISSVPHSEIQKYYAMADVFMLPSLSEGLPNVLLEVAACAKPIVATNTGGISDIVIHGKTGFLVEQGDINSFIEFIKLILNDEELSKRLGNNAYKYVKSKFDWSVIVKSYTKMYESIT
jgi:glycosyltransferase involved in cell wall biosynthesis